APRDRCGVPRPAAPSSRPARSALGRWIRRVVVLFVARDELWAVSVGRLRRDARPARAGGDVTGVRPAGVGCLGADVMPADSTTRLFLDFSRTKLLDEYWPRLRSCVETLTERQVWWRPNEASNSIGNLILHLNGNVRQWLVASFNQTDAAR